MAGAVTGDGGIQLRKEGDGGVTLYLNNTNNTFPGTVEFAGNRDCRLFVNSFVDSGSLSAGNIIFSTARADKEHWFSLHTGYNQPLVLNNRQVVISDNGSDSATESIGLRNNSSSDFTINTDLIVSGSGSSGSNWLERVLEPAPLPAIFWMVPEPST